MAESLQGKTLDSKSSQILVVEDEAEIRELISLLVLRLGHRVQNCGSAHEALQKLRGSQFDLMVLDWMLPNVSGLEFMRTLAQMQDLARPPILMVTAKSSPEDIVMGLDAGADDYITKPFEPSIFAARVKALLRRQRVLSGILSGALSDAAGVSSGVAGEKLLSKDVLVAGDIKINTATYEATCKGQNLQLTPSEFKILMQMTLNQGRVMTRDYLISVVQGDGITVTGRTIDTHVFGLRKKLGDCADWIETIRGVGYRIRA